MKLHYLVEDILQSKLLTLFPKYPNKWPERGLMLATSLASMCLDSCSNMFLTYLHIGKFSKL